MFKPILHGTLFMVMLAFTLTADAKSVKDLFESPAKEKEKTTKSASSSSETISENPIAEANDIKIDTQDFYNVLFASCGNRVLRQFIGLELARQMARNEGVEPSPADIEKEFQSIVSKMGPEKDASGKVLTLEDRKRILNVILDRRSISQQEFDMGVQRQAYLRAVVKKKIKVTDQMMKEEFSQRYGKKRKIRVIVVSDNKVAEDVFNQLQKGESFAVLAAKYSIDFTSAPLGGQMGEIAANDPNLPEVVVKAVFEIPVDKFSSPIKVNDRSWIVKVDGEIPAQPITIDKVKDELYNQISVKLENDMMEKLQNELFQSAKIKIHDKTLSKEFETWMKSERKEP
jgi:hypothetical protein